MTDDNGWMPIDTAPKDGTTLLVHSSHAPGLPGGRTTECSDINTVVAAWWGDSGDDGEWVCYMDLPSDPRCPFNPTHWQPLPPPPKTEQGV